jgi:hypothetical protein
MPFASSSQIRSAKAALYFDGAPTRLVSDFGFFVFLGFTGFAGLVGIATSV